MVRRSLLLAGAGILALWALFSPALGPVMDHHFAERHHNHSHIYAGPLDFDHLHPYEKHHVHGPVRSATDIKVGDDQWGPEVPRGVVFLSPMDGMGQDSLVQLTPVTQPSNSFPDQGDPSLLLAWPQRWDPLREVYVPPLKRPPRT